MLSDQVIQKTIIVMPAYFAAKTLPAVFYEVPEEFRKRLLLVDDASKDDTAKVSRGLGIETLVRDVNQGYGANQKTCYAAALEKNVEVVVMLHPDGQYDASQLVNFLAPLHSGQCAAVVGSRMMQSGRARAGGMPWWKFLANKILGGLANFCCGTQLTDWHSGYRAYTTAALKQIDFQNNTDGFSFDVEMATKLLRKGLIIKEIPIPTRYFKEASSINFLSSVGYGCKFAYQVIKYKMERWNSN